MGSFGQLTAQNVSVTGITGMDTDGASLIGCSDAGISFFTTNGSQVNRLLAANGPQTIVQPIKGPVFISFGAITGVAWNPGGAGGNGSFFVTNGRAVQEMDTRGNPLGPFSILSGPVSDVCFDICDTVKVG